MDFWDRFAGLYDIGQSVNGKVREEMARLVAELVPEGAKVLDAAAGTGVLTFESAKRASEVVCTDISLPMLAQARGKAERNGVTNVRFEARNIFHLEDENETYDVVMAGNVLHLLADPQGAVKELARVTKRGGLLILPTYTNIRDSIAIKLYKKLGFRQEQDFDPASYREMLENCNVGRVKARLIKGMVPCCFAVIKKD